MSIRPRLLLLVERERLFPVASREHCTGGHNSGFDVHVPTRLMHSVEEIERHGVTVHHIEFPRGLRSPLGRVAGDQPSGRHLSNRVSGCRAPFLGQGCLAGFPGRFTTEAVASHQYVYGSWLGLFGWRVVRLCIRQCASRVLRRTLASEQLASHFSKSGGHAAADHGRSGPGESLPSDPRLGGRSNRLLPGRRALGTSDGHVGVQDDVDEGSRRVRRGSPHVAWGSAEARFVLVGQDDPQNPPRSRQPS